MSSQIASKYFYGFPVHDKSMELLFQSMPAFIYCKDKQGLYLEVNDLFIHGTENKSDTEVFGKNDQKLIWSEQALLLMSNDQEVISTGKSKNTLETAKMWGGKIRQCLSYKTPLLDRAGKVIGVFGMSFLPNEPEIIIKFLHNAGFTMNPTPAKTSLNKAQDQTNKQTYCAPSGLSLLFS